MDNIPYGYCQCGCGSRTRISTENDASKGWAKGEPLRFIHKHRAHKPRTYVEQDMGHTTQCWIWQGPLNPKGYGIFSTRPKQLAHRVYYERHCGPIPQGLEPDHLCGVRACVNPCHLEPVTHTENMRRARDVKLSLEAAREIRSLAAATTDLSYADIARLYGVHSASVSMIVRNVQWKETRH